MIVRVWDFETTGMTPDVAGVIDVGWADLAIPARIISEPQSYLCGTSHPITPENRAIHNISARQLAGKEPFDADAWNAKAIEDGVTCLAAFNAAFDIQWLQPTLPVICLYKAALRAWPHFTSHSNMAVFYALEDQGKCKGANYAHVLSHRAGPDAYVSAWVLKALLDDGHTGKHMLQWSREPAVLPRCPVGKHKGKPWGEIDAGWLRWALTSDLSDDIKHNASLELERR